MEKVNYVKGFGKITTPNEVTVDLSEGGQKKLSAKNIIIATGSEVIGLPFLPVRIWLHTSPLALLTVFCCRHTLVDRLTKNGSFLPLVRCRCARFPRKWSLLVAA